MKVGITFDLREEYLRQGYSEEETAEFDALETIEAIDHVLRSMGHVTERIGGIRDLTTRLAEGARWDFVFNYAEGMFGFGREAQVPCLLDAFQIPYTFSDALVMALTLHKGMTKHVARDLGFVTAPFEIIHDAAEAAHVQLPYPLFVKPVAGGTSVGISAASRVTTPAELADVAGSLIERFKQPALVEALLTGRELTVGIVGSGAKARSIGVMEVLFRQSAEPYAYSYANKKDYTNTVDYKLAADGLAQEAAATALRIWKALGCRDGGRMDFRCDAAGTLNFIEVNPLAGLHPVHSDLVILAEMTRMTYQQLVEEIVDSATERLTPSQKKSIPPLAP